MSVSVSVSACRRDRAIFSVPLLAGPYSLNMSVPDLLHSALQRLYSLFAPHFPRTNPKAWDGVAVGHLDRGGEVGRCGTHLRCGCSCEWRSGGQVTLHKLDALLQCQDRIRFRETGWLSCEKHLIGSERRAEHDRRSVSVNASAEVRGWRGSGVEVGTEAGRGHWRTIKVSISDKSGLVDRGDENVKSLSFADPVVAFLRFTGYRDTEGAERRVMPSERHARNGGSGRG